MGREGGNEHRERYSILDLLPIGVLVLDIDFQVVFWNQTLEEWTGLARNELLGTDIRQRFVHLRRPRYARRLRQLFAGGPPALFSSQLHPHLLPAPQRSGRMRVLNTLAVRVPTGVEGCSHALLAIQDVSNLADAMGSLRRARESAEQLAATDPLTGVANRRQFFTLAFKAMARARRHDEGCTLMMIDIDDFKLINDQYGHAMGDELLRRLVKVLERALRQEDLIARIGGDEFAVLLQSADIGTARTTAERLRRTLAEEGVEAGDDEVRIRISVGLASLDPTIADVDEFLRRADTALYEAKRRGRDQVFGG